MLREMEETTNTFKYKQLDKDKKAIRLLNLHSAAKSEDGIKCDIFTSGLQGDPEHKPPKYEALSYMWGDRNATSQIVLQEKTSNAACPTISQEVTCYVTTNLESALRQLRSPSVCRTLWIDAICINQEDKTERKEQVAIMGEIYAAALGVLFWLGPAPRLSNLTWSLLEKKFTPDRIQGGNEAKRHLLGLSRDQFVKFVPELVKIQEPPVWKRVWIKQEIILAQHVTVLWGRHLIDWWTLVHLYNGLDYLSFDSRAKKYHIETISKYLYIDNGGKVLGDRLERLCGTKQSFLEIYRKGGDFECTDPRDRIYAVLGLAENNLGIEPDYNKPLQDILVNFVESHINHFKDLDILEIGSLHTRDAKTCAHPPLASLLPVSPLQASPMPSWAPDLAHSYTFPNPVDQQGNRPGYHAGLKGFVKGAPELDGQGKLTLWGVSLDKVQSVSETTSVTGWFPNQYRSMLLKTLPSDLSIPYFNGNNKFDAYWRTLVFDNDSRDDFRRLRPSELQIYREAARSILQPWWWSALASVFSALFFWQWHMQLEEVKLAMTSRFDSGKRRFYFGLTEEGYMAMLPQGTQLGDVVAILYGGKAPFILRPSPEPESDTYLLVGPAYVHGFMDGEAISWRDQDRLKEGKFVLI